LLAHNRRWLLDCASLKTLRRHSRSATWATNETSDARSQNLVLAPVQDQNTVLEGFSSGAVKSYCQVVLYSVFWNCDLT